MRMSASLPKPVLTPIDSLAGTDDRLNYRAALGHTDSSSRINRHGATGDGGEFNLSEGKCAAVELQGIQVHRTRIGEWQITVQRDQGAEVGFWAIIH